MGNLVNGWIKLHRCVQKQKDGNEFDIWNQKPFNQAQAWIDLLLNANYSDNIVTFNNMDIECKRGEQITSIIKLSDRWGWNKRTTKRFLNRLEKHEMVSVKCTTNYTSITIVNYTKYQGSGSNDAPPNTPPDAPLSTPPSTHKGRIPNKTEEDGHLPSDEAVGIPDDEIVWEEANE